MADNNPKPTDQSLASSLESKITLLADLESRVRDLRQFPALLRPSTGSSATDDVLSIAQPLSESARLQNEFQRLREVSDKLKSEEIQSTLSIARDSEQKDKTGLESPYKHHEAIKQQ